MKSHQVCQNSELVAGIEAWQLELLIRCFDKSHIEKNGDLVLAHLGLAVIETISMGDQPL